MTFSVKLVAQNYQALHGSDYAGSIAVGYNPSSILSSPLPWDVTLLGFQTKNYSNLYYIYKPVNAATGTPYATWFNNGEYERKIFNSSNLNLFNTRIKINRKLAISFGANIRSVTNAITSKYNYIDTITSSNSFLGVNFNNQPFKAKLLSSTWTELFGTLAKTVFESKETKLNLGVTMKVNRGISGIVFDEYDGRIDRVAFSSPPSYYFTQAELTYAYPHVLETWDPNSPLSSNLKNGFKQTDTGGSLDIGFEYMVKDPRNYFQFDETPNDDYIWKFSVSLMDLGFAQYRYGIQSAKTSGISPNAYGVKFENKFDASIQSMQTLTDTLKTMVNTFSKLSGRYQIYLPSRLVVNIDRKLTDYIFVNAEMSLNAASILYPGKYTLHEMNLFSITPRIENRNFGFYVPVSINHYGQTWMGAAIKAGPLLMGLHHMNLISAKRNLQNGGGYIALVISPYQVVKRVKSRGVKCPI